MSCIIYISCSFLVPRLELALLRIHRVNVSFIKNICLWGNTTVLASSYKLIYLGNVANLFNLAPTGGLADNVLIFALMFANYQWHLLFVDLVKAKPSHNFI